MFRTGLSGGGEYFARVCESLHSLWARCLRRIQSLANFIKLRSFAEVYMYDILRATVLYNLCVLGRARFGGVKWFTAFLSVSPFEDTFFFIRNARYSRNCIFGYVGGRVFLTDFLGNEIAFIGISIGTSGTVSTRPASVDKICSVYLKLQRFR